MTDTPIRPVSEEALQRAASNLYSGDELVEISTLAEEVCDYIERCLSGDKLQLDGAIRGGVQHIVGRVAVSLLTRRARAIIQSRVSQ
jgi:hypothetical protein